MTASGLMLIEVDGIISNRATGSVGNVRPIIDLLDSPSGCSSWCPCHATDGAIAGDVMVWTVGGES